MMIMEGALSCARTTTFCVALASSFMKRPKPSSTNAPPSQTSDATGLIWSRYATQITPVNYNLLAVNVFVGSTGLYQIYIRQKAVQDGRITEVRKKFGPGAPGAMMVTGVPPANCTMSG